MSSSELVPDYVISTHRALRHIVSLIHYSKLTMCLPRFSHRPRSRMPFTKVHTFWCDVHDVLTFTACQRIHWLIVKLLNCSQQVVVVDYIDMHDWLTRTAFLSPQSTSPYTLLKPKRHSLRWHDFMVHALLLRMCTNVVYFRVMRRLCRREWNWLWNWCVHQHSWDPWQRTTWSQRVTSDFNSVLMFNTDKCLDRYWLFNHDINNHIPLFPCFGVQFLTVVRGWCSWWPQRCWRTWCLLRAPLSSAWTSMKTLLWVTLSHVSLSLS